MIQTHLHADEIARRSRKSELAIDFAHDIAPTLQKRCAKCHVGTQKKGGFSINTRQTFLAGGDSGPAVVPGDSSQSDLIERVTTDDPALRMPPEGERLTATQIAALKRWVDAGALWEEGFVFGAATRQAPLAPRRPEVPPALQGLDNPVDRFLARGLAEQKVSLDTPVADRAFVRRLSFDLVGLPPAPDDLERFVAEKSPDKFARLVERLLDDRPAYAAHWMTFWNDLLRNAYHSTGFIDGGRRQITGWLYGALYNNLPYDRFVRGLVTPQPGAGSDGFLYGIKWRGTVNESQRREIQAAQSLSQVFLGTNLKCASCHDSFVNHWKLTDAYALASVFSDQPLELHRCDQPIGVTSKVGFLYPELGSIDPQAPAEARLAQLADLLLHPQNGRLARTIVNRLWARLFGRGLVEPLDNLDAEPFHQDLLDYLAADLVDHGYDLKHTLRLLAGSRAYRLAAAPAGEGVSTESYVFFGPHAKRLMAEQFVDAVFSLTSAWPAVDPAAMKLDGRGQGGQLGAIAAALDTGRGNLPAIDGPRLAQSKWIWNRAGANAQAPAETIHFRTVLTLDTRPTRCVALFTADNAFELFVNGISVAKSDNWGAPVEVELAAALVAGRNVIGLTATNGGDSPNPAGAIGEILLLDRNGNRQSVLATDATWRVAGNAPVDWLKPEFDDAAWARAVEVGDAKASPWNAARLVASGAIVRQHVAHLPEGFRVRAALMPLDPLQAALGRPNREQVVSSRDSVPTMLQALELTNGAQLEGYLKHGARTWLERLTSDRASAIDAMYLTAFSRPPSADESRLAAELVGTPATREGVEDLLWTLCMHPEFQVVP